MGVGSQGGRTPLISPLIIITHLATNCKHFFHFLISYFFSQTNNGSGCVISQTTDPGVSGNNFVSNFTNFSLDKLLGVCYNENSGRDTRQRPAKKVKQKSEKLSEGGKSQFSQGVISFYIIIIAWRRLFVNPHFCIFVNFFRN